MLLRQRDGEAAHHREFFTLSLSRQCHDDVEARRLCTIWARLGGGKLLLEPSKLLRGRHWPSAGSGRRGNCLLRGGRSAGNGDLQLRDAQVLRHEQGV